MGIFSIGCYYSSIWHSDYRLLWLKQRWSTKIWIKRRGKLRFYIVTKKFNEKNLISRTMIPIMGIYQEIARTYDFTQIFYPQFRYPYGVFFRKLRGHRILHTFFCWHFVLHMKDICFLLTFCPLYEGLFLFFFQKKNFFR